MHRSFRPRFKVADEQLGRVFFGSTPSEPIRARNAFLAGAAASDEGTASPWPADLRLPSYAQAILEEAIGGAYELAWVPVTVGRVVFFVNARPLRMRGVFVDVSPVLQQQLADLFEAILPTPKMMDLAWLARAATIPAVTLPIASTADAMVRASRALDAAMAAAGDPAGVIVCQKTWSLGNSLLAHPGRAMNYGDFVLPTAGTSWRGIATEGCVSIRDPSQGRVIQGQGWAHNLQHIDYSQVGWFVLRRCTIDGVAADLAQVLGDPELAPLVSHEGVVRVPGLRQPGVPVDPRLAMGRGRRGPVTAGADAPLEAPELEIPVFDPPTSHEQGEVQGLLSLVMLDHNTLQREGDSHESAVEIDRTAVIGGLEQLAMTASGALRASVPRPDLVLQAARDAAKVAVGAVDAYTHSAGPLGKSLADEMMRASGNAQALAVAIGRLPGTTPPARPVARVGDATFAPGYSPATNALRTAADQARRKADAAMQAEDAARPATPGVQPFYGAATNALRTAADQARRKADAAMQAEDALMASDDASTPATGDGSQRRRPGGGGLAFAFAIGLGAVVLTRRRR
jgi:hypothetical protein